MKNDLKTMEWRISSLKLQERAKFDIRSILSLVLHKKIYIYKEISKANLKSKNGEKI